MRIRAFSHGLLVAALVAAGGCNFELGPLTDAQNYSYTSEITAPAQTVGPGDGTLDWSTLDVDLLGRGIDPSSDVDTLQIIRYNDKTVDELTEAINDDDLQMSWVSGAVEYHNQSGTSAAFGDFVILGVGTPIDPDAEVVSGPTYLVNAASEDVIGYRMLTFFQVDESSDNHDISLAPDSADLEFSVDLGSAERIQIKSSDSYVIDWTDLTVDGTGGELRLADIDELLLARYELGIEEIEADFLRLEEIAERMFRADIGGLPEYELYDLVDDDGVAFDGFDKDGTWILALRCSTCINPAPPFVGVFEM